MRLTAVALLIALPLAACQTTPRGSAANSEVSAVVLDEGKRQEAAQAAADTKNATAAMAEVREGPTNQAPIPN